MNAYLDQMNRMSDTLRSGIGAIARDRLNKATMGLEEKKLDYALARDEREWNDPTKAFAREEAQGKLDAINQKKNTPFRFRNAFSDDPYGQSWALTPAKDGKSANDLLSEHIGAKINFDLAPDDPNYGAYIKPDGTPLTQWEWETLHRDSAQQQIIGPRADPFHMNRDHVERLQAKKGRGETFTPEDEEFLKQWDEVEKSPALQMKLWQQRLNNLAGSDGPYIQQARERAAAKIEELQARINAAEQTAYERRMAEREYQLRQAEAQGRAGQQTPAGSDPQAQGGQTQYVSSPGARGNREASRGRGAQQGQGEQMAQGNDTLPAEITNALRGSPGKALRIRDGSGQVRVLIYRNGRIDELSPDEVRAMEQAQADRPRAAPKPGSKEQFDENLGRAAEQLRQHSPIYKVVDSAVDGTADILYQVLVGLNNDIAAPFVWSSEAITSALREFQDWAKNRSPNARARLGKQDVQQFLQENPKVAKQVAKARLGGR